MAEVRVDTLFEDVYRLGLPGWAEAGRGAEPTNLYLLRGAVTTLIGAGHPVQMRALRTALDALDLEVADVDRVVVGSWAPEALSGCMALPSAEKFVFVGDADEERPWEADIAARCDDATELRAKLDEDLAPEEAAPDDAAPQVDVDRWMHLEFAAPAPFDYAPFRPGETLAAGDRELVARKLDGAALGQCVLWDEPGKVLFGCELAMVGLPRNVVSANDYVLALHDLATLEPDFVLPLHGDPVDHGGWVLERMARFCNNYMGALGTGIQEPTTLFEFVARDFGYRPDTITYLEEALRLRPFLDGAVESGLIRASGEGVDRVYGVAPP